MVVKATKYALMFAVVLLFSFHLVSPHLINCVCVLSSSHAQLLINAHSLGPCGTCREVETACIKAGCCQLLKAFFLLKALLVTSVLTNGSKFDNNALNKPCQVLGNKYALI